MLSTLLKTHMKNPHSLLCNLLSFENTIYVSSDNFIQLSERPSNCPVKIIHVPSKNLQSSLGNLQPSLEKSSMYPLKATIVKLG